MQTLPITQVAQKNISKKYFAHYAQIPYYTVAGWKKSGKVLNYAMVILQNIAMPKTVTDAGLPRAIFWNNDLLKAVQSDIFIVSTLQKAYNDFIIDTFVDFFTQDAVLAVLMRHRDKLSDRLIDTVTRHITTTKAVA